MKETVIYDILCHFSDDNSDIYEDPENEVGPPGMLFYVNTAYYCIILFTLE